MSLEQELNRISEVRFDPITRIAYSVDASIYEIEPLGVILPQTKEALVAAVKIVYRHGLPIIPRGAATGITGGCLGNGLIIDTSKYLHRILEINTEDRYAIVEPGVVQDQLNLALSPLGYRLGPDTSTGDRATLGGMVANNSAGARSLYFGTMADHLLSAEVCLANGELIEINPKKTSSKKINDLLEQIRADYGKDIQQHFPKIPRQVSGYNLRGLIEPHLCKLMAGSEGTLGIFTKIKVAIVPKLRYTALCVTHFQDLLEAMNCVREMLALHPISLEMIDDKILHQGRQALAMRGKLGWLVGDPKAVIVAEVEGNSMEEALAKIHAFQMLSIGYARIILTDPEQMSHVWEVRKAGLGLLLSRRTYSRAIAFIEDLSVPAENLFSFMKRFTDYLATQGKEAGIYGHVGPGCLHIRPFIDLRDPQELKTMRKMMQDVSDMILEAHGALSGEHGDGLIRSWLNPKMFGEHFYQAFLDIKKTFDPENRMNPGKIVRGPPLEKDLRQGPTVSIPTFLDFSLEGGFELAADLCNGNGLCRKTHHVMCPSFQVSKDEYDTTRARAQALRAVIHGSLPKEKLAEREIYEVMDLCIECKGCKTECPSNVDMAKMKAEVLYQFQERQGYLFRNLLFGHLETFYSIASPFATLLNKILRTSLGKKILELAGITNQRPLPTLAIEKFSARFKKEPQLKKEKKVALFCDTYTEFIEPDIGIAAVKILNDLGYEVILPKRDCCGRPLFSKGLLKQAKKKAQQLVDDLLSYVERQIPIILLEPSCLSMLKDDFMGLLGNLSSIEMIQKNTFSLADFLYQHLEDEEDQFGKAVASQNGNFQLDVGITPRLKKIRLPLQFKPGFYSILLHGHCHQKAALGMTTTLAVLNAIPGVKAVEIESGCCGMAGAFGYEKEHFVFSKKIGELKLAPTVRAAPDDAYIVADGVSCRNQIFHLTGKKAFHLAEIIDLLR
jgi:FAD/FMN-containing dehydrogenase/Fe-S oxidoreductase